MANGTEGMVPSWAVQLVANVAEIKARTDTIPDLTRRMETVAANQVPMREFQELATRVDRLWDRMNTEDGERNSRKTRETWFRWGVGAAVALLSALQVSNYFWHW